MSLFAQQGNLTGVVRAGSAQEALVGATVLLEETQVFEISDEQGRFRFENLEEGIYHLFVQAIGYNNFRQTIDLKQNTQNIEINLDSLEISLEAVEVNANNSSASPGLRQLRNVEGFAIYAAKKSEVIDLSQTIANLATNNARQVFKGIAGLNIWENDGAGLQLSIGARGLDPNRTSNFNTRQNGYDISADALGYPESYYTPPTQALEKIEIVRGAASLQYGPQFGGLLNFVFKKGPKDKVFEFTNENTMGSFGLLTTFNSIGGSKDGWNYYTFYQRKQGKGWRENSEFFQNTAYAQVSKTFSKKLKIGIEYTYMDYLAKQAGGLVDFEFERNPRLSKRDRNWFKVNWNLVALNIDYPISDRTKINSRSFFLTAQRQALGELGPINRPDPLRERDLIRGNYQNFGNETRLIHRYTIKGLLSTFLIGARYYQGHTTSEQGNANDGSGPDFNFLNPDDLEWSAYEFPSRNISFFAENLFNLNDKWSVTPGARFEYIKTASDGFYKERVFSGGEIAFERKFEDAKKNNRSLLLLGLGVGYKMTSNVEWYTNFSQNYRSINFSDLAVVNPNLIIDSLLMDERGYNLDLGVRGKLFDELLRFDINVFHLQYKNRIGIGSDPVRDVAIRANIGDARILGLEAYMEVDLWDLWIKKSEDVDFSFFTNFSLLHGTYLSGLSYFEGNDVELIPPFSIKSGVNLKIKNFRAAYQYAYVGQHFSDASNAIQVANATRGILPAYQVQDLSLSYTLGRFRFQTGVNNLGNAQYFTRRAAAYPGPGIIPSDGRSFYGTVSIKL